MEKIIEFLPLIIPLVVIQVGLAVYSLVLLKNANKVIGGSKIVWVLIILFVNLFGPIIFLLIGRIDDESSSEDE